MSLPPGFLDELRARLPLSQVVGRKVTWDIRKTNQGKGDWWAPCPFHQEKTASFHVDDRKGFYYCFGCQAKGDLISFVTETQNVGFIDAVEILAREAGLEMPQADPRAREKADRNARLIEANETAARLFRLQLAGAAAGPARDYLARRGLDAATLERFGIGYAPDARHALCEHLKAKGFAPEEIVAAGLAIAPEGGGAPFDRFRGRIMFPIRDGRGRTIAFGGRAMDPGAQAKYLNSPETPIFSKGRTLYNLAPAREAAGKGAALVVAEGYMDVIALAQAGFGAAVAPLGTAITEDQLRLIWAIAPEPVVALDGDKAGLRAAERLAELALPLIAAGQSLRFALLPEGQDPDDLTRRAGPGAMRALIETAEPMSALLWRRETEGAALDTPERRAALDAQLRKLLARIADSAIRAHYAADFRVRRAALFAPASPPGAARHRRRGTGRPSEGAAPLETTRRSQLAATPDAGVGERLREAAILALVAAQPRLAQEFAADLEAIDWSDPAHASLQAALLALPVAADSAALDMALAGTEALQTLEKLRASSHVRITPALQPGAPEAAIRQALRSELAQLRAARGARRELEEAVEDLSTLADEGITWRLGEAARVREHAARLGLEDSAPDTEDLEALSQRLQSLIDARIWVKKR
ncbi:MAG: DNA primase [Alphaproteobacteria bacterium HGW-Alphaproteobacteria-2]|nr:MAG: DNA primase [Alphaproteobacteria bacterium HGW-Alphaproteobacteria-2]